ncbi:MAG: hypothetical protein J5548_06235 [Prevotella sp.]|nr:hypothetical protein [Prevotella sp.]
MAAGKTRKKVSSLFLFRYGCQAPFHHRNHQRCKIKQKKRAYKEKLMMKEEKIKIKKERWKYEKWCMKPLLDIGGQHHAMALCMKSEKT